MLPYLDLPKNEKISSLKIIDSCGSLSCYHLYSQIYRQIYGIDYKLGYILGRPVYYINNISETYLIFIMPTDSQFHSFCVLQSISLNLFAAFEGLVSSGCSGRPYLEAVGARCFAIPLYLISIIMALGLCACLGYL